MLNNENFTIYEKFCKFAGTLGIKPPKTLEKKLEEDTLFSTLSVSSVDVFSATILSFLITSILVFAFSFFVNDLRMIIFLFFLPLVVSYYIYSYPSFKTQVIRVQTGDEAIKLILYMVIYLRLHSSLEGAVKFASEHVKGPISNDIRKAMWGIKSGKYNTIEEAFEIYKPKWMVWNKDFIRSLSLLSTATEEPSPKDRQKILKESLSYLLTNTHRNTKTYIENIARSINILHFLGMILPLLGLICFPIISILFQEIINPFYIGVGYIILLPIIVYFFMNRILQKRPSAFITPDISKHPNLPPSGMFSINIADTQLYFPILPFAILFGVLIMLYGTFHFMDFYSGFINAPEQIQRELLKREAEMNAENFISPLSITFGFWVILFLYFYLKSFRRIRIRNKIKSLESELQTGLFSLGNYMSEGYPLEEAIEKNLDEYEKLGMQKRLLYSFFSRLLYNIKTLGMSFERAVFDEEFGILRYFPSVLIEEIMRILSDALKMGYKLVGSLSRTFASYLEEVNRTESKIKELLGDIRDSIKIEASFIVPLICGVIGPLSIFILNTLSQQTGMRRLVEDFTMSMPITVFQSIAGIFMIEIVTLFSILLNRIENGFDEVSRDYTIAKTLSRAIIVYAIVSVLAAILFHGITISIIETSGISI